MAEARQLASEGCKEIILLGQTVNSYRYREGDRTTRLSDLLHTLHEIERIERIRFITNFPKDMTDDLLEAVRDLPKCTKYLHVPVQSGSNRILERMKRGYTVEEYCEMLDRVRDWMPEVAVTSDFIVGFCGETDDEFQQTCDLVRESRFKNSYIFKYSERPGTKGAEHYADDVPELVKKDRNNHLLAIQNAISHQALMENQRLEKEMQVAKTIQQDFLPLQTPEHDQFLFAAKTIPARIVGGDFYDFIPFDDRTIGIVLGDVSGKGVGAALHMARLMCDFRYVSQTQHEPPTLLGKVYNILFERARRGLFTTVVYAVLDRKQRTMRVANAGHHPILLLNKKKKIVECGQASGAPLGIIPKVVYKQEEIKLHRGDTILIYTDGAVEPKNKENVPFGLQKIRDLLIKSGSSPEDLIDKLQKSIQRFVAGQQPFDDLTFLSFRVL